MWVQKSAAQGRLRLTPQREDGYSTYFSLAHSNDAGLSVVKQNKKKTPGCIVSTVVKGFISSYLSCMSKNIQTFTALCFKCHGCMMASHSALTANGSNQRNFKSKENSFRGPHEALSSYWIQLLARCGGRTTLTSHSSPRSLLSANTKLRTTGLLTG